MLAFELPFPCRLVGGFGGALAVLAPDGTGACEQGSPGTEVWTGRSAGQRSAEAGVHASSCI